MTNEQAPKERATSDRAVTTWPKGHVDHEARLAKRVLELRQKLRKPGANADWAETLNRTEDVLISILDRHVRGDGVTSLVDECFWCSEDCECGHMSVKWPCPEVRAVLFAVRGNPEKKSVS